MAEDRDSQKGTALVEKWFSPDLKLALLYY